MASKAWINTVAYLSIVAGAGILLKQKYKGKNLHNLANRLGESVDRALDIWQVHLDMNSREDAKNFKTIETKTKEFDSLTFGGDIADPKVLTSTLLGISNEMEGIKEVVSNTNKREVLNLISMDLNRLHRHFDSRGMAWDSYAKAEEVLKVWDRIFKKEDELDVQVSPVWRRKIITNPHLHTSRKKKPLVN